MDTTDSEIAEKQVTSRDVAKSQNKNKTYFHFFSWIRVSSN